MPATDKTSKAIERLRETFDEAAAEAEEMSESARREVEDAIDDLEERIDNVRND